jgi:hypothetical protein
MMLNTLTYNIAHSSGIEIAMLGILIVLLNLRALSLTAKTRFLDQLRNNLLLGIIPTLLVSILIMINLLITAFKIS